MKNLKKYLPVIALLLFVALVIIALIVAQGVSRKAPIAPTAPEKPKAAVCLVSFDIVPPVCNSACTQDSECATGTVCFKDMTCNLVAAPPRPCPEGYFCDISNTLTEATIMAGDGVCRVAKPVACNLTVNPPRECPTGYTCRTSSNLLGADGTCVPNETIGGFCRNPECTKAADCICPSATPTATPSPTPTATPTATPTGSPTPTPTGAPQGGFFIRKYNDKNGNGKQDTSETGLTWNFQWSQDNGTTWNDYQTDETKLGEGGVVYLPTDTKVKIREIAKTGWTSTTATNVELTIKTNDNQLMVFGNWQPVSSPTPTATPVAKCNSACVTNSDCPTSMNCVNSFCRNPSCVDNANCVCQGATATPTATPEQLPKSGVLDDTLKLLGAGAGAIILGLIALLAL